MEFVANAHACNKPGVGRTNRLLLQLDLPVRCDIPAGDDILVGTGRLPLMRRYLWINVDTKTRSKQNSNILVFGYILIHTSFLVAVLKNFDILASVVILIGCLRKNAQLKRNVKYSNQRTKRTEYRCSCFWGRCLCGTTRSSWALYVCRILQRLPLLELGLLLASSIVPLKLRHFPPF